MSRREPLTFVGVVRVCCHVSRQRRLDKFITTVVILFVGSATAFRAFHAGHLILTPRLTNAGRVSGSAVASVSAALLRSEVKC